MDIAGAVAAGQKIYKVAAPVIKAVRKYVDKDLNTYYSLVEPLTIGFHGIGIGIGDFEAGPLKATSVKGGKAIMFTVSPFDASSKYWNGPNVIPDNLEDGSMEASLLHDLIWFFAKDIGKQVGMSETEVMAWGNGILVAAWRGYGGQKYGKKPNFISWCAFNLCEWSKHWWHKIFAILALAGVCATLTGCSGCASPPDWELDDDAPTVQWVDGTAIVDGTAK